MSKTVDVFGIIIIFKKQILTTIFYLYKKWCYSYSAIPWFTLRFILRNYCIFQEIFKIDYFTLKLFSLFSSKNQKSLRLPKHLQDSSSNWNSTTKQRNGQLRHLNLKNFSHFLTPEDRGIRWNWRKHFNCFFSQLFFFYIKAVIKI